MQSEPTPGPSSVKTRVLIISDTHNQGPVPSDQKYAAYREPLPSADILLLAGDITLSGKVSEYQGMVDALSKIDAELKLVIAGNHDTTLDWKFYEKNSYRFHPSGPEDKYEAWNVWHGEAARNAGIVYLEEGTRSFTLKSGARFNIYASPYQPDFYNWAFSYQHHEDRFNEGATCVPADAVNPVPSFPKIDIMMTHGPPFQILDRTSSGTEAGCPHLLRAAERCRPRLYCFGHIHEGWGAERVQWMPQGKQKEFDSSPGIEWIEPLKVDHDEARENRAVHVDISSDSGKALAFGEETLFVNAAVMNLRYQPIQSPWLVHLDLPVANGLDQP